MKKILLCLSLVISILKLEAQVTKGNWLFGGNINFSSYKITSDVGGYSTTTIECIGNAGYFFMDKLAGGIRPNLFFAKTKSDYQNHWTNRSSIGPFLRYYLLPEEQRVNLFVDGSYAYGTMKVSGQKAIPSHAVSLAAGPAIFLNTSVALELSLGYSIIKFKDGTNDKRNIVQVGVGLQFHLEK